MGSSLTAEERSFLLQALATLQLAGTPDQLREALRLIDSIVDKLSQELPPGLAEQNAAADAASQDGS